MAFTDLNKACSFLMPMIDQLVDATAQYKLLSFMDVYSGYNKIPIYGFRPRSHGVYNRPMTILLYNMSFGLKKILVRHTND